MIDLDWRLLAMYALAGWMDAIVGGGGLISLPALMLLRPDLAVVVALGTNKAAAFFGTASAAITYLRRVEVPRSVLWPAMVCAALGGIAGASLVSLLPAEFARVLVLALLIAVFIYMVFKPDFGTLHAPKVNHEQGHKRAAVLGGGLGFYEGIFGPGTGSFLIFGYISLFGFSFVVASAAAKGVNAAASAAALTGFAINDHILWSLVVPLAIANVIGAQIGARMVMRRGPAFVRPIYLLVVGLLISRLGWQLWAG